MATAAALAGGPMSATPNLIAQPLVDAEHVARMLSVKRARVYELTRRAADPLPCVRIGGALRFVVSDVAEWVTAQAST